MYNSKVKKKGKFVICHVLDHNVKYFVYVGNNVKYVKVLCNKNQIMVPNWKKKDQRVGSVNMDL